MTTAWLRAPLAALAFLTIVPVGRTVVLDGRDVARSTPFLPVVGGLVGSVAGLVTWGLAQLTAPLVAAAVGVAVAAALTGALHLDGLADTADGFGARTPEDALRIMRDHNIGAYGAVALVLELIIKVAAVAPVAERPAVVGVWVAAGALSRGVAPVLSAWLPYVQRPGGSGSVLGGAGARPRAVVAAGVAMISAAAIGGWVSIAVAAGVAAACAGLARRRFGGVTGDVLGATTELVETVVLVTAAALA